MSGQPPGARGGAGLDPGTGQPGQTALRLVWSTPLYLRSTVALFLAGLGFSAAAPQIASFLVGELHASLTVAGLYYLTNLTAPVAGYLVGARSDRTGSRLGLFRLCAVVGFAGWSAIALAPRLWVPFVVSAVVLGFAGAATSQLFAAIHDQATLRPRPANDGVVAIVRMALTAGWVVGPVAGSFLAAVAGSRVMLLATAVATLAQLVPLGALRDPGPAGPRLGVVPGAPARRPRDAAAARVHGALHLRLRRMSRSSTPSCRST